MRIPGCLTGLAAIKGQFGRIPVWPVSATTTLAHVGPMARTVEDAALLFMACAGHDARDPYSVAGPVPDLLAACKQDVKGLARRLQPDARLRAARRAKCCASSMRRRSSSRRSAATSIWSSACSSAIRSISGRRNSTPAPARGCGRSWKSQRELIDPAVADILEQALRQELRDYYSKVFERYALRDTLRPFFERYDILLSPVLPVTSLDVGKNVPDHLRDRNLVSWVYYTYPFNLTGQPAATVCAGIAATACRSACRSSAACLAEADVVRAAAAYERSQPKGYNVRAFRALIRAASVYRTAFRHTALGPSIGHPWL